MHCLAAAAALAMLVAYGSDPAPPALPPTPAPPPVSTGGPGLHPEPGTQGRVSAEAQSRVGPAAGGAAAGELRGAGERSGRITHGAWPD